MNIYITLSIIGVWFLYALLIKITKKRKYDFSFVVAFVFLLGFGYFYFYDSFEGIYYTYFNYAIIAIFALWLIVDNISLLFNKNGSDSEFHDLEKELEEISSQSELLRRRFVSTIELINDGIAFRDEENIFGTDRYIEIIGLNDNQFTFDQYRSLIHKDDLIQYDLKLEKLSKKYPTYRIKYRVKKEGNFLWISEYGKMIILDKKRSYISTIKTLDLKLYPETDVDVLNNMLNMKDMYEEMQKLSRQKRPYYLIMIQLTNIPKINEKYGRDFGDLMMGEYLSKLRFKFIKDSQSLFRISGIVFGLLIKEKVKFDLLDRALVGTGELMTLQMNFGGVTQTLYPNLGIAESPYEAKNPDVMIQQATKALELACREDYDSSFCFYNRK